MATDHKKREWFKLGAEAFARVHPGTYGQPTYPCPICLKPFTIKALADGRLTVEHVPPESFGGPELLLTCKDCNNSAGSKLDADAKMKEDVRLAMAGMLDRPHRVKATFGEVQINAELLTSKGGYALHVPAKINKPGASDTLVNVARAGTQLTVEARRYADLGAKISWFRSGYLILFAVKGYDLALDPAYEIVRTQIMDCDERKMVTFTSEAPEDIPLTVQRLLRVFSPDWHGGWAVQFGRYLVHYPSLGDMTFYDRMAASGGERYVYHTTGRLIAWPTEPIFGFLSITEEAKERAV